MSHIVGIDENEDKYLILIDGDKIYPIHSSVGTETLWREDWTVEIFDNQSDWLVRLGELGVVLE